MKNLSISKSVLPLSCLYLFAFCTHDLNRYASKQRIDILGWHQHQEYSCKVLIEDTHSLFNIDITGQVRFSFPYDSLSLVVKTTSPSGNSFCDTLSFGLTNTHNRLWEEFRFPYCSKVCFSEAGVWLFSFQHNMNAALIRGVMGVGIYIYRVPKQN